MTLCLQEVCGIPNKIIKIIKEMYGGYSCKELHQWKLAAPIVWYLGVKQGCILYPSIFLVIMDELIRRAAEGRRRGLNWRIGDQLEAIDFADDVCLLSQISVIRRIN